MKLPYKTATTKYSIVLGNEQSTWLRSFRLGDMHDEGFVNAATRWNIVLAAGSGWQNRCGKGVGQWEKGEVFAAMEPYHSLTH